MMKKLILLSCLLHITTFLSAQDILVLKKDESELKVKIASVNDTIISYRLWQSTDTSLYSLKRFEVLSFLYEDKPGSSDIYNQSSISVVPHVQGNNAGVQVQYHNQPEKWNKKKWFKDKNANLLEKYHSGEQVNGYVIKSSGDSIAGIITVINVALNQFEVNFTGSDNKNIVYTVKDLKAYGYGDLRYEKVKTKINSEIINKRKPENGELFMNIEINGPAKLYRFYTLKFNKNTYRYNPDLPYYFGKMKNFFLITNPSGRQMNTKSRTIKGAVNNLFQDNKELLEEIRMKGVNSETIHSTVSQYNEWYLNKK